jgi:hypothetical protein
MSDERKKPGVAFWATVVVVAVLLAYPLSFGPACWICGGPAQPINGNFCAFYRPLLKLWRRCPQIVQDGICCYVDLWLPPDLEFLNESDDAWFRYRKTLVQTRQHAVGR